MRNIARACVVAAVAAFCPSAAVAADKDPAPRVDGEDVAFGVPVTADGSAHRELVFPDGVKVILHSGATVILLDAQWYPAERSPKPVRGYRVLLKEGDVTLHVPENPAARAALYVSTPTSAAIVAWRGVTELSASAGETRAAVSEGAIFVGANAQWLPVHAGAGVVLRPRMPPEGRHPLLAAPAWVESRTSGFAFARSAEKVPVRLAWQAVANAALYRIEVAADEAMTKELTVTDVAATMLEASALVDGNRFARVRAIGADKLPGQPTAPRAIRVATAAMPPGATVGDEGLIVVGGAGELALGDARGLELATSGGNDVRSAERMADAAHFGVAPDRLRFGNEPVRVFRLRHAASGTERRFVVARRDLRAEITLGPKRARWPEDTLEVRAHLVDRLGSVASSKEPVSFEVRVNGEPMSVEWARTDEAWVARIPPRIPPGPWLVTVVSKNAAGSELGDACLEVDGPRGGRSRRAPESMEVTVSR